MMYRNQYVLAIRDQSKKVLREIDGKVYLPFNTEYSLLLKNASNSGALCKVSIDGTDVLGGDEIFIPAGSSSDLERFITDGNKASGKKFMFVPLSNSQVQDPTSGSNGLVEVHFWATEPDYYSTPCRSFGKSIRPNSGTFDGGNMMFSASVGSARVSAAAVDYSATLGATPTAAGATVAGSDSNQKFGTVYGKTKVGEATVLRLQLMGRVAGETEPILVNTPLFCTTCGKAVKFTHSFCSRCGTAVQVLG